MFIFVNKGFEEDSEKISICRVYFIDGRLFIRFYYVICSIILLIFKILLFIIILKWDKFKIDRLD